MPPAIAPYVHPDPPMPIGKPEAIFTISFDIGRSNSSLIVYDSFRTKKSPFL